MSVRLGVTLNVLALREEEGWVALALEMDLRGYGETLEEALAELDEIVEAQISFATAKGRPEMIYRPAEPVYWEMHARTKADHLRQLGGVPRSEASRLELADIPLPPPPALEELSRSWVER